MKRLLGMTAAGALALSVGQAAAQESGPFIVSDLTQSPDEAVAAIRDYAESRDEWLYMAEFGLAGGKVTAVKICYAPLGPDIVAAGWHVMAMMPCGHLAFYEEDGQSRMSRLDLDFMTELNPDPSLEEAVRKGKPAFAELFEATLQQAD